MKELIELIWEMSAWEFVGTIILAYASYFIGASIMGAILYKFFRFK